jgi:glycosyltransferase involved in cell wall biosynthesis
MKKLVIQIPALNESASIGGVLTALPRQIEGVDSIEVVVVNDGSTDDTADIARRSGAIVVSHDRPQGVGAAFRSGLKVSLNRGADIIVTMDADGQFNAADMPRLIAPILAGQAGFVTASRFKDPDYVPVMPVAKRWGNMIIAKWLSRMTDRRFDDVSCGYRAYSREAALLLNPQGDFTYTHEVFLCLAFSGVTIQELPTRVRGVREKGTSRVASSLSKYAFRAALIILATYRDYRPMAFFGGIASALGGLGGVMLLFLFGRWIITGALTPFKFVGFAGVGFMGGALVVFLVGLVAAMLVRLRKTIESLIASTDQLARFGGE